MNAYVPYVLRAVAARGQQTLLILISPFVIRLPDIYLYVHVHMCTIAIISNVFVGCDVTYLLAATHRSARILYSERGRGRYFISPSDAVRCLENSNGPPSKGRIRVRFGREARNKNVTNSISNGHYKRIRKSVD